MSRIFERWEGEISGSIVGAILHRAMFL